MRFDTAAISPKDAYALMISAIVPRPIAFVSTVDEAGTVNLAPFSFFTGVASRPPLLALSIGQRRWQGKAQPKDTLANIQASGELVVNIPTVALAEQVNASAAELPPGVSELEHCGLTAQASVHVRPPRVLECPVQLECKLSQIVWVGTPPTQALVLAEIVCFHVAEAVWSEALGGIDPLALDPLSRLGGQAFGTTGRAIELARPDWAASGFSAAVERGLAAAPGSRATGTGHLSDR